MSSIDLAIILAMEQEAAPFLSRQSLEEVEVPSGAAWLTSIEGRSTVIVRSGIGLVNAAVSATHVVDRFRPRFLFSGGSAGGVAQGIFVGDVVAGTSYAFFDADASTFGYEVGQIPGMPPSYPADQRLADLAAAARSSEQRVWTGKIVSGNSFVDADSVGRVRDDFRGTLAADMESAALAQVAYLRNVPYISVRAISDLCGPEAGEDFSMALDDVAERSAAVIRKMIVHLPR